MAWSIFEEKEKVQFAKPFSTKYRLTISNDTMAGSMKLKSVSEMRWQFAVKNLQPGQADISLILLSNRLVESNSPLINEISGISQAFAGMYAEIEATINEKAEIVSVNNIEIIREKWGHLKAELEKMLHADGSLKNVILLNDDIFSSPEKIKIAVKTNEFFGIYFNHFFGRGLPFTTRTIERPNLFNTAPVGWQYQVSGKTGGGNTEININGDVVKGGEKSWGREAYKSFAHVLGDSIPTPILKDGARYTITPWGKVLHASVEREETVHPAMLYSQMRYELEEEVTTGNNAQQPVAPTAVGNRGFSLLADD